MKVTRVNVCRPPRAPQAVDVNCCSTRARVKRIGIPSSQTESTVTDSSFWGTPMLSVYALFLALVAVAVVGLLVDEGLKVGRPFATEGISREALTSVISHDRRTQHLPFVGQDRREIHLTVEAALAYAEIRRGA